MRISDGEGTQLREQSILAKQQVGQTVGMFVGNKSQEKLPEGLLRMLEDNKTERQRNTNQRAFRA